MRDICPVIVLGTVANFLLAVFAGAAIPTMDAMHRTGETHWEAKRVAWVVCKDRPAAQEAIWAAAQAVK